LVLRVSTVLVAAQVARTVPAEPEPPDVPRRRRVDHRKPNQFALLGQRRFGAFLWVQFLGASNDNLFKFAFTVLVTCELHVAWLPPALAGLVIGALFIAPFVLSSATSGQLADQLEKTLLIRGVKWLEIGIMLLAAWGFVHGNVPALLACNRVSCVDPLLLMAASPRPIRFLIDCHVFSVPVLGRLFRVSDAIPMAPRDEDPAAYERALAQAARVLAEGDILGIFPEGRITADGGLGAFEGGIMKILRAQPVPVVLLALRNPRGSWFERGAFGRVGLVVGVPLAPAEVTPEGLRERVQGLLLR
jgi:1-acyl-sn-glycerol-3-phosphate acyltransferase